MINSPDREVGSKNAALHSLNQTAGNVYHYDLQGTPQIEVVATDKYKRSQSGAVPDSVAVDEGQKWTRKDWYLTAGVAAGCLLIFYFLVKYKVITI